MNEPPNADGTSLAGAHVFRLLVVCSGNMCRSPMAEAVFKRLAEESGARFGVSSRGLIAPARAIVHPLAVKACRNAGIEIEERRVAERLDPHDVRAAALILVMDQEQRRVLRRDFPAHTGKVYTLGHWLGTAIEDPLGGDERQFTHCLNEIQACAATWLERLRDMKLIVPAPGMH